MSQFRYKAKNAQGETVSGSINAQNETDAVSELRRQGLVILSLGSKKGGDAERPASSSGGESRAGKDGGAGFFSLSIGKKKPKLSSVKVKSQEMVVFTRQLSTMISAGIPLVESLEILAEQSTNPGFKLVLEEITSDVRSGKDLSQAFGRHSRIFTKIYINMLKAGEASGQLDTVLNRLAEYQEASAALKSEIKSAMTYPVVSLVLVLGITMFLLVFIIPKFEEMFSTMDVELPAITRGLIATSLFLKNNFILWMLSMVMAGVALSFYIKTDRGATQKDWLILKLPIFGPLFSKVALSRFRAACRSWARWRSWPRPPATGSSPRPSPRPRTTSARARPSASRWPRAASSRRWSPA
jgi:type IV pilus assembly protein PilC